MNVGLPYQRSGGNQYLHRQLLYSRKEVPRSKVYSGIFYRPTNAGLTFPFCIKGGVLRNLPNMWGSIALGGLLRI